MARVKFDLNKIAHEAVKKKMRQVEVELKEYNINRRRKTFKKHDE